MEGGKSRGGGRNFGGPPRVPRPRPRDGSWFVVCGWANEARAPSPGFRSRVPAPESRAPSPKSRPELVHLPVAEHQLNLVDLTEVILHVVVVEHAHVRKGELHAAAEGELDLLLEVLVLHRLDHSA